MASTNLPAVYFNNVLPTDLLNVDTMVTFTVNMSNAVAFPGSADSGHTYLMPASMACMSTAISSAGSIGIRYRLPLTK